MDRAKKEQVKVTGENSILSEAFLLFEAYWSIAPKNQPFWKAFLEL